MLWALIVMGSLVPESKVQADDEKPTGKPTVARPAASEYDAKALAAVVASLEIAVDAKPDTAPNLLRTNRSKGKVDTSLLTPAQAKQIITINAKLTRGKLLQVTASALRNRLGYSNGRYNPLRPAVEADQEIRPRGDGETHGAARFES